MCTCRICNKNYEQISPSHLKTHGLSTQEYREMYPEERRNMSSCFTIPPARPRHVYADYTKDQITKLIRKQR